MRAAAVLRELAPMMLAWSVLCADLVMHEWYLRMYSDAMWLVLFALAGATSVAMAVLSARRLSPRAHARVVRVLTALAAAAVLWRWGNAVLPAWADLAGRWKVGAMLALAALSAGIALALPTLAWRGTRRAIGAACLALVASTAVLLPLRLDGLHWPPQPAGAAVGPGTGHVLMLLLDELGAEASAPVAQALRDAGWTVTTAAVTAIGDMTAKVVPQMLSGRPFPNARPCGASSICDATYGLDFSRIEASRPDIDIVGFYHPYCDIPGLRWCRRVSPPVDVLSIDRWGCAIGRVAALTDPAAATACNLRPLQRWAALVDDTVAAIDAAPFWRDGGLLYAHVPLPHPPGRTPGEPLPVHYGHNIAQAAALVGTLARRARVALGDDVRIVVFSDHGLRWQHACASPLYARVPCDMPAAYRDARVPVIVAASSPVDLGGLRDNAAVFRLADRRLDGAQDPSDPAR